MLHNSDQAVASAALEGIAKLARIGGQTMSTYVYTVCVVRIMWFMCKYVYIHIPSLHTQLPP
jgi:hypothetical protein